MNYLISGAGSGIGQAMALAIAAQDHQCVLLGRNREKLEQTLSQMKGSGHQTLAIDICDANSFFKYKAQIDTLVLDGIIANAGIGGENQFGATDRWDEIIQTNLTGTYLTVNHFLKTLEKSSAPFKQIILTSSVLARLGVANYSAYCASKAGLLGLMRAWAVQWAPKQILVNAICPGWVDTQMSQDGLEGIAKSIGVSKAEFFTMAMESVPLKKMSEPHEIAALVLYLLQQSSMTGQVIDINGGAVMNS